MALRPGLISSFFVYTPSQEARTACFSRVAVLSQMASFHPGPKASLAQDVAPRWRLEGSREGGAAAPLAHSVRWGQPDWLGGSPLRDLPHNAAPGSSVCHSASVWLWLPLLISED